MSKMWNRYTYALIIAAVGIIVFAGSYMLQNQKVKNQTTTTAVLVATQDIQPFSELTADNTKVEQRVVSDVPEDAIANTSELKDGKSFASSLGFLKGNVVQKSYLTTAAESKRGTSVSLPAGHYEIGVKIDLATAAGGEVKAGIKVDAVAFISANGGGGGQTVRNDKLKHLEVRKVVNSEGVTPNPEESNATPAVAVLEVDAQQRDLLVGYQEMGKVYLTPASME